VAVAARAARAAGAARVAIVDWDVHHGNGTQDVFWDDPSVLYLSLHRLALGFFPGTGAVSETGAGAGAGFTVNIPFADTHLTGADYLAAFRLIVLPILGSFDPELVLISAGFDAVVGDPLGKMAVPPAAFGALTELLLSVGAGRVVAALEGGYNEDAIASCAECVVAALLRGRAAAAAATAAGASGAAARRGPRTRAGTEGAVRRARDAQAGAWPVLAGDEARAAFDAFWADEREARARKSAASAVGATAAGGPSRTSSGSGSGSPTRGSDGSSTASAAAAAAMAAASPEQPAAHSRAASPLRAAAPAPP
jgi:hypothetical protein